MSVPFLIAAQALRAAKQDADRRLLKTIAFSLNGPI